MAFLTGGDFLTTIDTKLGKTRGMIWILDILTPMYGPQTIVRKTLSHYRSYSSCPVNSGKGRYILITFTECESVFERLTSNNHDFGISPLDQQQSANMMNALCSNAIL